MKKLPIGIQSFASLRRDDYLYVDKTSDILRLVTDGKIYFLSRPRRFGKSLLLNTLSSLFQSDKELFEGLYIYDRWDWSESHPVIRLDWTGIDHSSSAAMEKDLCSILHRIATGYKITLTRTHAAGCFEELIKSVYEKTGSRLVVLIDEYDSPMIDVMHLGVDIFEDIRDVLQSFYRVLKVTEEYLRFVFLTGVSKFTKVSIFSALNSLNDITLNADYATLCGYTQEELESYFAEYVDAIAARQRSSTENTLHFIRNWYNGYSWDGSTSVYNPFSVLLLCATKTFEAHWFETGTPSFLVHLIKDRNDIGSFLEPKIVDAGSYAGVDLRYPELTSLLWQTGYLTVKESRISPGEPAEYTLGIPNREVRESMLVYLLSGYSCYATGDTFSLKRKMLRQLCVADAAGLEQSLRTLFAGIPHQLHIPKEAYYHSLFLLWLQMLNFDVQGEVSTNLGRIDAVWRKSGLTIVIEIKYHPTASTESLIEEALSQIHTRRYYEAYLQDRVILLAIAVGDREVKCKAEPLTLPAKNDL